MTKVKLDSLQNLNTAGVLDLIMVLQSDAIVSTLEHLNFSEEMIDAFLEEHKEDIAVPFQNCVQFLYEMLERNKFLADKEVTLADVEEDENEPYIFISEVDGDSYSAAVPKTYMIEE